ncbi:MAG: PQQ-binding-like beta-propeller repeat protein [Planctomycetia bacterium]|nr:PQQ-binding-like beta-propeller repeat protein [Planctomycetia bacterium]
MPATAAYGTIREAGRFSIRLPTLVCLAALISTCACMPARLSGADKVPLDLYGDPLPAGAAVRLGSIRFRINSSARVEGLSFASNNRTLVVAGGNRLALFQAPTGKPMYDISTGEQWIRDLRLIPGLHQAVTLGHEFDETVPDNFYSLKCWDLANRKLVSSFRFAGGAHLRITPDGKTAITGNGLGVVQFWNFADGKEIRNRRFENGIQTLALSADGDLLAVSAGNSVHYWNWRTGDEPVQVRVGRTVQSLVFSSDGRLLAEGPDSQTDIILRDVRTREVKAQLSDAERNPLYVHSLAFSPDGRWLAGTNSIHLSGRPIDRRVHVWDISTGMIRNSFATGGDSPRHVCFSANGRWLAAAGDDSIVNVWDTTTGQPLDDGVVAHAKEVNAVRLSHDGHTAVTASADGTVRVWDATTGKQRHIMQHANTVRGADVSPDGALIASSSHDDTVRLWDTATGKPLHRLRGHGDLGGLRTVAFAADGRSFASWGDHDSTLRIWDVKTGEAISDRPLSPLPRPGNKRDELRFTLNKAVLSPGARELVFCVRDAIVIFDVESGKEVRRLAHADGNMVSLAIGPDATLLATSSWGRPREIALASGGFRSSADKDHIIRVREVTTDRELFNVPLPDHGAGPVAFSADGGLLALAVCGTEGSLEIVDARSGAVLQSMDALPPDPSALAFSGDGKRLACGYIHGSVLIWDLKVPMKD